MSWKTVKLGDVCELITKGTTPTTLGRAFQHSGIPFLRVQNIQDQTVDLSDAMFIDASTDAALSRSRIKPNDLLISIAGTIGRAGIVPEDAAPMNCNQAVAIIRLKTEVVVTRFILYWLATPEAKRLMLGAKVTGTISNLSLSQIANLQIPLPLFEQQKRIASILDRADALLRLRRQSLALLDELAQSMFLGLFGDPVVNPNNWPVESMATIANVIGGYAFKSELFSDSGVGVVRISNIQKGVVTLHNLAKVPRNELGAGRRFLIHPGDLLIAMSGATTGKLGLVPFLSEEIYLNQRVGNIKPKPGKANIAFLQALFESDFFQKWVQQLAWGAAQPNISGKQIESVKVPIPPLLLQNQFADQMAALEVLKKLEKTALTEAEALFASLQERAFNGNL